MINLIGVISTQFFYFFKRRLNNYFVTNNTSFLMIESNTKNIKKSTTFITQLVI